MTTIQIPALPIRPDHGRTSKPAKGTTMSTKTKAPEISDAAVDAAIRTHHDASIDFHKAWAAYRKYGQTLGAMVETSRCSDALQKSEQTIRDLTANIAAEVRRQVLSEVDGMLSHEDVTVVWADGDNRPARGYATFADLLDAFTEEMK